MTNGPLGLPSLAELRPFVDAKDIDCNKRSSLTSWYSSILDQQLYLSDFNENALEQEYNRRYSQNYDDVVTGLEHSLGIEVGDTGQVLFVAQERHSSGLIDDNREAWVLENDRDEKKIKGIQNLLELTSEVLEEIPEKPCIYRGLHGEVASYIKQQLHQSSKVTYFTRAIEFWSQRYTTAVNFSLEGIRNDTRRDVDDAIVISKKLEPHEILMLLNNELRVLPDRKKETIHEDNTWVIK